MILGKLSYIFQNGRDCLTALGKFAIGKDKFVDHGMADHRAAVCAGCEHNLSVDVVNNCSSCNKNAEKLMIGIIGNRSTQHDKFLKNCNICKCFNKVQIWFPLSAILTEEKKKLYPDRCWKIHK